MVSLGSRVTYARAALEAALGDRRRKKLQPHTYAYRDEDGTIRVRLYETDVVVHLPDGSVRLNNGGWPTVTTKDRIARWSGVRVWQRAWVWYVENGMPFKNGMVLNDEGES